MKKTILIILLILWMIIVFLFSSQPGEQSDSTSGKIIDVISEIANKDITEEQKQNLQFPVRKTAHFLLYALGGALSILLINEYQILSTTKKILYSQAIVTIYAITDEIHQYFVSTRSAQITDILLDSIGGLTAILIITLINQKRKEAKNV